jgi:hypothetical protein
MKTTMIAATIALGLTAGAALADQPMVLTNAQLDQVTGGPTMVEYGLLLALIKTGQEVSVTFTAAARAEQNDRFLFGFEKTFFDGTTAAYGKTVPPGGVGVKP